MKLCIYGLWHLGSVTAACLAGAGFEVVGIDDDAGVIANLKTGRPPLYEPDLEGLIGAGLASGNLDFSSDLRAIADADLLWVTFDTPVDDDDRADTGFVVGRILAVLPLLRDGMTVLVSSQLPVGTMAGIERSFAASSGGRHVSFAYAPENLRLGRAIDVFRHPERVIVGIRDEKAKPAITRLLTPFTDRIIWVGTEAAELTKHALNAFLATSVTFINEIADLAEKLGADAGEVERALRSEPRIGQNAYIRPGAAFAGGTLARDVNFLGELGQRLGVPMKLIGSILASNREHSRWSIRKLRESVGSLEGRRIAVLGISYKPGTDAIRRSFAIELLDELLAAGAQVVAFDPAVKSLPPRSANARLADDIVQALSTSDAAVLMTEWPEFKSIDADLIVAHMRTPLVLDQNRFLGHLASDARVRYLTIGKPA
jgi:UDPglucose 6-dehydrogenase